jgi:hypothetical protein
LLWLAALASTAPSFTAEAAAPPVRAAAQEIRFLGAFKKADADYVTLSFELVNADTATVQFLGFRPDSFDPPLPRGRAEPLWFTGLRQRDKWEKAGRFVGCGVGMGWVSLAGKARVTFTVDLPVDGWQEARISLMLRRGARERWSVTSSSAFTIQQVEKVMKSQKKTQGPKR